MPDMDDALRKGLLAEVEKPAETDSPQGNIDAEILYEEFKSAPDAKAGVSALKQLIRSLGN